MICSVYTCEEIKEMNESAKLLLIISLLHQLITEYLSSVSYCGLYNIQLFEKGHL